jgi:hypothetical protein
MQFLPKSKAEKRYTTRMLIAMSIYILLVLATTHLVRREHITGVWLYVCAVLPSLPILRVLQVVGLYLKEETDEFMRQQVVTSLLWAMAAVLALTAFTDFLRSYTTFAGLPPFSVFVSFWIIFGLAQAIQSRLNQVTTDE